jgi:hypothetical protein
LHVSAEVTIPQNEVLFDDLAESMKILLSSLSPGEYAVKYDTGNEQYTIRLEKVEETSEAITTRPDREHVKVMLEEYKQQQQNRQLALQITQQGIYNHSQRINRPWGKRLSAGSILLKKSIRGS